MVVAPPTTSMPLLAAQESKPAANIAGSSAKAHIVLPKVKQIGPETKLDRYMNLAAKRLDPRMQSALSHIPDEGRRLLAIKYYSRRTGNIASRWAMSENQIAKYRGTKQHRTAVALVEAIQLRFAEQNPGYRLKVNTDVRALESQIELWNTFASTGEAGESILASAEKALADSSSWPDSPSPRDIARFTRLVASTGVSRTPTAAVPGFSLHGTGRAFDFIVYKGDEIIAGADAASARRVWDKPGWTKKLRDAITAVSDRFDGPLQAPYEPWHYNYRP